MFISELMIWKVCLGWPKICQEVPNQMSRPCFPWMLVPCQLWLVGLCDLQKLVIIFVLQWFKTDATTSHSITLSSGKEARRGTAPFPLPTRQWNHRRTRLILLNHSNRMHGYVVASTWNVRSWKSLRQMDCTKARSNKNADKFIKNTHANSQASTGQTKFKFPIGRWATVVIRPYVSKLKTKNWNNFQKNWNNLTELMHAHRNTLAPNKKKCTHAPFFAVSRACPPEVRSTEALRARRALSWRHISKVIFELAGSFICRAV